VHLTSPGPLHDDAVADPTSDSSPGPAATVHPHQQHGTEEPIVLDETYSCKKNYLGKPQPHFKSGGPLLKQKRNKRLQRIFHTASHTRRSTCLFPHIDQPKNTGTQLEHYQNYRTLAT
jgi:hypothetical protein